MFFGGKVENAERTSYPEVPALRGNYTLAVVHQEKIGVDIDCN